jgi:hypothetical protein
MHGTTVKNKHISILNMLKLHDLYRSSTTIRAVNYWKIPQTTGYVAQLGETEKKETV